MALPVQNQQWGMLSEENVPVVENSRGSMVTVHGGRRLTASGIIAVRG